MLPTATSQNVLSLLGNQSIFGDTLHMMMEIAWASEPAALSPCHLQAEHPSADAFRQLRIQDAHQAFARQAATLGRDDRAGLSAVRDRFFGQSRPVFSRTMIELAQRIDQVKHGYPVIVQPHEAFAPQTLANLVDENIVEEAAACALSRSLFAYFSASVCLMETVADELRPLEQALKSSTLITLVTMFAAAIACGVYGVDLPEETNAIIGGAVSAALQYGLDMLNPLRLALLSAPPLALRTLQAAKFDRLMDERLGSSSQSEIRAWKENTLKRIEAYKLLREVPTLLEHEAAKSRPPSPVPPPPDQPRRPPSTESIDR